MKPLVKNRTGFSMIEVLVVIGIMVILLAIATPSVRSWSIRHQKAAAASEIFALLNQARSLAISNSRPASVTIATVATPPGGSITATVPDLPPFIWTRTLNLGSGRFNAVGLVNPAPGGPFTISPRGTVSPAGFTLRLQDQDFGTGNNETVSVTVGLLGDITITH